MVAAPVGDRITKALLTDIAHEVKALKQEVGNIRSAQGHSGSDIVGGGTWVQGARKKTVFKGKTVTHTDNTPIPAEPQKTPIIIRERTRPPRPRSYAIIVGVNNGKYCEELKKLKDSEPVKAVAR